MKQLDQRLVDVLNLITREIREKQLSQEELDEVIEHVKHLYYTDALIA